MRLLIPSPAAGALIVARFWLERQLGLFGAPAQGRCEWPA